MSPSNKDIEKAIDQTFDELKFVYPSIKRERLLAAAYRASEARAELLERQLREGEDYAQCHAEFINFQEWLDLLRKQAREREALE
jgi:hypothetical protein